MRQLCENLSTPLFIVYFILIFGLPTA